MTDTQLSPTNATAQTKKAYAKPMLSQIRLVAEEAVLSTCKLGSVATKAACEGRDLICRYTATS